MSDTEFRTGRVSGDQDFGNNALLNQVSAEIRATADKKNWEDKGDELKKELCTYLANLRLRSPVNEGPVVEMHEEWAYIVLVFEGDRYFIVSAEVGYDQDAAIETGYVVSIETARRIGLLAGVADIDAEYKQWQLEDTRRREKAQGEATLKRLKGMYTTEEVKRLLGIEDA